MNILFVCGTDPRLTDSGTTQRTHFLWKALSGLGCVYTVVLMRKTNYRPIEDDNARIRSVLISPSAGAWRWVERLFEGITKVAYMPPADTRVLEDVLSKWTCRFDCVVSRYMVHAAMIAAWRTAPLFIDVDDIPVQAFDNVARMRLPRIVRPLSRFLVERWQSCVLSRARGAWVVKARDLSLLKNNVVSGVLYNRAKDVLSVQKTLSPSKTIITVGMMSYAPNVVGVDWFVNTVWKEFHKKHPDFTYEIMGKGLREEMKRKWESVPGVQVLGFVEDLGAKYCSAAFVVTPITTGAGSCIKVVEAPLHGVKTLSTAYAACALSEDVRKNLGIEVFNSAADFCDCADRWLSLSQCDRERLMGTFRVAAERFNSFETFAGAVSSLIARGLK